MSSKVDKTSVELPAAQPRRQSALSTFGGLFGGKGGVPTSKGTYGVLRFKLSQPSKPLAPAVELCMSKLRMLPPLIPTAHTPRSSLSSSRVRTSLSIKVFDVPS